MVSPYSSDTGSVHSWTRRCGWCQHRTGGQFQRNLVVLEGQEGQVGLGLQKSIQHLEREKELFSINERMKKFHVWESWKFKGSNLNFHPFTDNIGKFFFFTVTLFPVGSHIPARLNLSLSSPSIYKQTLPASCEKHKCFTLKVGRDVLQRGAWCSRDPWRSWGACRTRGPNNTTEFRVCKTQGKKRNHPNNHNPDECSLTIQLILETAK